MILLRARALFCILLLALSPLVRADAASPRTRVIILGVDHSVQLVSPADQAGLLTVLIDRLNPDAICIERPPDRAAKGEFYEFTYEVQGIVLPSLAKHPRDLCPVDWMPSLDDQMLAFGKDLDVPPEIRRPSDFFAFPDRKVLSEDFFVGEDPAFTDPVRKHFATAAAKASQDFPRRLFLYRTFLQAERIKAAAKAHPGGTVLVVIGYFHKGDIEAILADDPSIEIIQPSSLGRPDPQTVEAATTRSQRAAVLSFNLLGRQEATGNVDWRWIGEVLGRFETGGVTPEAELFRTRYEELTGKLSPRAAAARYRRIAERTPSDARFAWTGVRDRTRLDSYYDPFGNLSVRQRAWLEFARASAASTGADNKTAAAARLLVRSELSALQAREFDAYAQAFLVTAAPAK